MTAASSRAVKLPVLLTNKSAMLGHRSDDSRDAARLAGAARSLKFRQPWTSPVSCSNPRVMLTKRMKRSAAQTAGTILDLVRQTGRIAPAGSAKSAALGWIASQGRTRAYVVWRMGPAPQARDFSGKTQTGLRLRFNRAERFSLLCGAYTETTASPTTEMTR